MIRIVSGGQYRALYGVGTVTSELIDEVAYDWEHTVARACGEATNLWRLQVIARDPRTGENLPAGFEVRWREAHHVYDGSSSPTRMKTQVVDWKGWSRDGSSGRNKEVIEVAYGPGRHFPRVEIWRTHGEVADPDTGAVRFVKLPQPELTGYAEIHSLAVEAEVDRPLPVPNAPVPAAIRRGTAFHLTNFAGGKAVDAKLAVIAIRGGSSRGRVSLDGYPQNQSRYISDPATGFDDDLAQVLLVGDGEPRTVYLQGYESPSSNGKDDLELWAWGQAHLETCPESCWHLDRSADGDRSPVKEPFWQLTDTEPFNACRLAYLDRHLRRLAALELHNDSPGIELDEVDKDMMVPSLQSRRVPIYGQVRDALLPIDRVSANRRELEPVYPAEFVGEGLENGEDFPGRFERRIEYSRHIDVPIRATAVNAVGNLACDGYLLFLAKRQKGFFRKFFSSGADGIVQEVIRTEWFTPWHREIRHRHEKSHLGGERMYPGTDHEDHAKVGHEEGAPHRREDPFFRPVLQGFYDDYDPFARVRFAEDLAPKRVQFFAQEASRDVGACSFLMLAYDLLGAAPDAIRIAAPTDDDPDATASAPFDDLNVWEEIEGKRRSEKLGRTRHRAQLGWQPDGAVVLADQELPIFPEAWITGVRVLTTDERGDEALLVRDQPLAGCELPEPAGEDRRKGFRVEAAHPDFRCEPQVEAGYDPRGWFDEAPDPAIANQFDTRIHLLPGHGHRGRVFALRPDRKIVTSVYHPGEDVVDRPLRDEIETPWEPDYPVDPAVLPIKVVSGGFLRLHVAGDWDGAPRFELTKHLRNKAYMTMGDSLTAGFSSLNLRDREQLYGHGIQVARMMGVPFTVAQVADDGGFADDRLWGALKANLVDLPAKFIDLLARPRPAGTNPDWHHNVAATGATVLSLTTNAHGGSIANEAIRSHQRITLPTEPLTGETATQPQAAIRKRPSLAMLGIGSNNALGALLDGEVAEDRIVGGELLAGGLTHPERFRTEYEVMLDHLVAIRDAYGTDFVLVDVPDPSLAPPVVYRAREDETSPTGRREESFLDPAMPSYILDFDKPGFEPYTVPMRPDGRSVDYHMGIMPLGARKGSLILLNLTKEVERAPIMVHRSLPRAIRIGRFVIPLPSRDRFLHPDRAGYGGGGRRNRYIGLSYWGAMHEGVLFKSIIEDLEFEQMNISERTWITDRERDRLVARVMGFNDEIQILAGSKEMGEVFQIQNMFDFIDEGGAVIDPSWWEREDEDGTVEDLPPVTIDRSKLGGGFSGDLFHPLPTGYAIFGDRILFFVNTRLEGDEGFGGFTRAVPRIIPEGAPIGQRPIDRVAEQDEVLRHILFKRIRTITQYPGDGP